MEPINSFITLAEKITILNKDCVEILLKMNDVVTSENSTVAVNYDNNGITNAYSLPTVGYLKTQIDTLNQNMKRMASIDGYTFVRDGKSFKRIMTSDLNKEPMPISDINQVTKFTPINNWFFESLMNPMLAVTIDLTDKVGVEVNKILSRRYIIKFQKDDQGILTSNGLISYKGFESNFLGRTDVNITDFLAWYNNPSNIGIVIDTVEPYDEQVYDLKLKTLNYYGVFSVIKVEIDDINNKMWYHVNDIKYYGQDGSIKNLAIGDELIINKLNSSTRYKIVEVNTDSSNTKIRLEIVEGYDPVVVGINVLKYYSDISNQKSVQINVGFDEYIVEFVKPINTDDNIVGNIWSKGICFYTNDLLLDINDNINLASYYVDKVYDYGTLLKDMIKLKIPTAYGVTPNKVVLIQDNFKIVQINKHLTDSKDQDLLKKLHSEKTAVKTKLDQLNSAISQKTSRLYAGGLTSTEKTTLNDELTKMRFDLDLYTKSLSSLVSQINDINSNSNSSVDPKYRIRGFFSIPEPIISEKTEPQHVIQFKTEYRYSSKSGNSNNTETFNYSTSTNTTNSSTTNVVNTNTDVSTTSETSPNSTNYANFSNWIPIISGVRKRYWDENTKTWYWKIEDVSDADVSNINQLDIPISPNEKVEIRVKSLSEVGWPDSPLESDWSDVMTITWTDDLNDNLSDTDYIKNEALQDEMMISIEELMNSKGVYRHIGDSFFIGQDYYTHTDKSIQVSFKDSLNNSQTLFQYLIYLENRIKVLEETISASKGTLKISIFKGSNLVTTVNNNTTTTINVSCEDYGYVSGTTTRTYANYNYVIEDYMISLENIASAGNLGFLSNRSYTGTTNPFYTNVTRIFCVDADGQLNIQKNNQFVWFADSDQGEKISRGDWTLINETGVALSDTTHNLGTDYPFESYDMNVYNSLNWTGGSSMFMSSVFPYLPNLNDLVETGQEKTKIINPSTKFNIGMKIYFRFKGDNSGTFQVNPSSPAKIHTKKIKFYFELSDNSIYQFVVKFNISQFNAYVRHTEPTNNSLFRTGS